LFANKTDRNAPRVRVIVVAASGPAVRDTHSAQRDGGASLGFACAARPAGDSAASERGALRPAAEFEVTVPRPDGNGDYTVRELYYHAPDGVLIPCVVRPSDVAPIAPIDTAGAAGGPAYAGITVADVEREAAFYAAVLGLEKRRDFMLKDPKLLAAAGLPADAEARFVQLFAPGTTSGNLTLIDLGARGERNANMRPPARGIAAITFRVQDVLEVRRRLKAAQGVVVAGPLATTSSVLGTYKSMTALTPGGMMVEFVELLAE
jgi:catechol 2,3-dioxygenase-like lactoylglutathione lyase family enzyme